MIKNFIGLVNSVLTVFLFLLFSFVFLGVDTYAQELSYVNYSTHNGMPSSQVYSIYEDKNGYIWFATDRGIVRYDGYQFESFDINDGLPSSTVFRFFPQKNGQIWCSTFKNKWFWFSPDDYIMTPYRFNDTIAKYTGNVINEDLTFDKGGNMYVSYVTAGGFLKIDTLGNASGGAYQFNKEDSSKNLIQEVLPGGDVISYKKRDSEKIRVSGTSKKIEHTVTMGITGFSKMTNVNDDLYVFTTLKSFVLYSTEGEFIKEVKSDHKILGVGQYDENHFWVGWSGNGLGVFSLDGTLKKHLLKGKVVSYCYRDQNQGIWVSTLTSGVYYAKSDMIYTYDNDIGKKNIKWLGRSKTGELYVLVFLGKLYKGNSTGFDEFGGHSSSDQFAYYNKLFGEDVFYHRKHLSIYNKILKVKAYVTSFSKQVDKPLLFAGQWDVIFQSGDTLRYINTNERSNSVLWAQGGIYQGTKTGMYLIDTLMNTRNRIDYEELDIRVESICNLGDRVVAGTMGNGLVVIGKDSIFKIGEEQGLTSNLINKIYVEDDSVVWVATNTGANRVVVSGNNYKIDYLTQTDGLVDNDISDIEIINDMVWLGTRSGLCSFPKTFIEKIKERNSQFHLRWKNVLLHDKKLSIEELQDLSHNENELTFEFFSTHFINKSKVQYRFMLKGLEERWNYTQERKFHYPAIPPGEYNLIVQASANDDFGEENELSLTLLIHPPFYETAWFKLLVLCGLAGIVYLFFRFRVIIYNREILREVLRFLLKRMKKGTHQFLVKEHGKDVRIDSSEVLYVKASGNYSEIQTETKKYLIRSKLSDFPELVPDKLEYLRVNRSYIVRIDKIEAKSMKSMIVGDTEIPIGKTYQPSVAKLDL